MLRLVIGLKVFVLGTILFAVFGFSVVWFAMALGPGDGFASGMTTMTIWFSTYPLYLIILLVVAVKAVKKREQATALKLHEDAN